MIAIRPLVAAMAVLAAYVPVASSAWGADLAAQATGVGATFPQPAYAQWIRLFAAETGERENSDA